VIGCICYLPTNFFVYTLAGVETILQSGRSLALFFFSCLYHWYYCALCSFAKSRLVYSTNMYCTLPFIFGRVPWDCISPTNQRSDHLGPLVSCTPAALFLLSPSPLSFSCGAGMDEDIAFLRPRLYQVNLLSVPLLFILSFCLFRYWNS
jgi:hypothetical protein